MELGGVEVGGWRWVGWRGHRLHEQEPVTKMSPGCSTRLTTGLSPERETCGDRVAEGGVEVGGVEVGEWSWVGWRWVGGGGWDGGRWVGGCVGRWEGRWMGG